MKFYIFKSSFLSIVWQWRVMYEQIKVYFYQYLFNSRCFKFARCNSHAKKMPARRLALENCEKESEY